MEKEKPQTTHVGHVWARRQVERLVAIKGGARLLRTPKRGCQQRARRTFCFTVIGAAVIFAVTSPVLAFAQTQTVASAGSISDVYRLDTGDSVRITVFDEEDMSTSGVIDDQGNISIPLLGAVRVAGLPLRRAERLLTDRLRDGYLVRPRVNVEVTNYRPFYTIGEVNRSGSFPYVVGITVHNAIALSGGFTKRADRKDIVVTRKSGTKQARFKATLNTKVLPGDIIEVDERFF